VPANDPNGQRFGEVADAYDRGRPGYPGAAVDWLLASDPRRILDLGAGTGKLTEAIVDRADAVVAVEPSEGMRLVLARKLPTVTVLAGTAEAIPLPSDSVDAVVVGQAWHWVDAPRAAPEVARVLAPDGMLGLIWNDRDEDDPWIAGLTALLEEYGTNPDSECEPVVGAPFGLLERREFAWTNHVTPDDVVDMVLSRSYVIALPDEARSELVERLRLHLASARRDVDGRVLVPYLTRAYVTSVV
jgi:SAM-dependent methyltransferase